MSKAMIISVGTTPEPIIKSINNYKPKFVSFLASQESNDNVTEIKAKVINKITSQVTILDNPEDLLHCHQKAEEAVERVINRNYSSENVIVDYTCGTKNMSVALSLAAITHSFVFSYVGGTERSKDGRVKNGCEKVCPSINPWDFLAIEEKKRICLFFNNYQYKAALKYIDLVKEKTTKYRPLFNQIAFIINGFYLWDLFKHVNSADAFKRARIDDMLVSEDKKIRTFAKDVKKSIVILINILKKSGSGKRVCNELVLDLYANSERRAEEGKVDDAILRLYRLVEMLAQERLYNKYQIDTSNINQEQIPKTLREMFSKEYKKNGQIKIPQSAAFQLLKELNDPLGNIFYANEKKFKTVQSSRNNSYLAHGFKSSKETTYQKLKEFVLELKIFSFDEAPRFPKLSF